MYLKIQATGQANIWELLRSVALWEEVCHQRRTWRVSLCFIVVFLRCELSTMPHSLLSWSAMMTMHSASRKFLGHAGSSQQQQCNYHSVSLMPLSHQQVYLATLMSFTAHRYTAGGGHQWILTEDKRQSTWKKDISSGMYTAVGPVGPRMIDPRNEAD